MGLSARLRSDAGTLRRFSAAGASPSSLLLYPVRRRLPRGHNRIDVAGGRTLVAPAGEPLLTMFEEVWVDERYRPDGWRLAPGGTVVDVGANVGVFALWAATRAGAGRVVCAEPSPQALDGLRANVARNRLTSVTVLPVAVGGERRKAILYNRGPTVMDTLYARDHYGSTFRPGHEVEVVTLAELFEAAQVDRCDLLKLDCEGAEYEILLGAGHDTLARVDAIVMEYHVGLNGHGVEVLVERLGEQGFAVRRFDLLDVESGHLHAVREPATTLGVA